MISSSSIRSLSKSLVAACPSNKKPSTIIVVAYICSVQYAVNGVIAIAIVVVVVIVIVV